MRLLARKNDKTGTTPQQDFSISKLRMRHGGNMACGAQCDVICCKIITTFETEPHDFCLIGNFGDLLNKTEKIP